MLGALRRRLTYYAIFAVVFGYAYTAVLVGFGEFPPALLFGLLGVALLKDVYDEWRIHRGEGPLAFVGVEHTPSNLVLLAFLLAGVIVPAGTVEIPSADATLALSTVAVGLAVADTAFDVSQDLREA